VLDVILTVSETTPSVFVHEARLSATDACQRSRAALIEVPGVPGHIGKARLAGLARSTADYVAWVDDDDLLLPNALTCILPHLAAKPVAVFARELHLFANGLLRRNDTRHHLAVFSRDIVDTVPLADFPCYDMPTMVNAASAGVDELSWVYIRRIYLSAGAALRAQRRAS